MTPDPFEEWYHWYPEFNKTNNLIPRPQPIDAVIHFFGGMKEGFFIDVGAYDGITWSNSLALEKYYGWTGICIEPNDKAFKTLKKYRNVECINSAITNFDGEVEFINVDGYAEMLSGIPTSMPENHLSRIKNEIKNHGGQETLLKVKANKIETLLEQRSITKIDYLSIDVECGELNVLKSIDFEKTKITLISCEVNCYVDGNDIQRFLFDLGYKHLGRVCGDEFFSHGST